PLSGTHETPSHAAPRRARARRSRLLALYHPLGQGRRDARGLQARPGSVRRAQRGLRLRLRRPRHEESGGPGGRRRPPDRPYRLRTRGRIPRVHGGAGLAPRARRTDAAMISARTRIAVLVAAVVIGVGLGYLGHRLFFAEGPGGGQTR